MIRRKGILLSGGIFNKVLSEQIMFISDTASSIVIPVEPFLVNFFLAIYALKAVLMFLVILVLLGSFLLSRFEKISFGEALYFSIITGFTIGYGDYVPKRGVSRVIAVFMGLIGLLFTGIVVAACVHAVNTAFSQTFVGAKIAAGRFAAQ